MILLLAFVDFQFKNVGCLVKGKRYKTCIFSQNFGFFLSFLMCHVTCLISCVTSNIRNNWATLPGVLEVEDHKRDVPLDSISWRKDKQTVLNVLLGPSVIHWYVHCNIVFCKILQFIVVGKTNMSQWSCFWYPSLGSTVVLSSSVNEFDEDQEHLQCPSPLFYHCSGYGRPGKRMSGWLVLSSWN